MSNYICMVGAIPIGVVGCIWKSHIMIICSLIGVLFHRRPDNKLIKGFDLSLNVALSCKGALYDNNIMLLVIISGICYILNCHIYKPENPANIAYNIRHICIVNIGGLCGYYILYKHEPCIEFYFQCEDHSDSKLLK